MFHLLKVFIKYIRRINGPLNNTKNSRKIDVAMLLADIYSTWNSQPLSHDHYVLFRLVTT